MFVGSSTKMNRQLNWLGWVKDFFKYLARDHGRELLCAPQTLTRTHSQNKRGDGGNGSSNAHVQRKSNKRTTLQYTVWVHSEVVCEILREKEMERISKMWSQSKYTPSSPTLYNSLCATAVASSPVQPADHIEFISTETRKKKHTIKMRSSMRNLFVV